MHGDPAVKHTMGRTALRERGWCDVAAESASSFATRTRSAFSVTCTGSMFELSVRYACANNKVSCTAVAGQARSSGGQTAAVRHKPTNSRVVLLDSVHADMQNKAEFSSSAF